MNLHIIIYVLLFFIFLHLLLYFFNIDVFEIFEKNITNNIINKKSDDDKLKKNIINELQDGMEQLKDNLII